MTLEERYKYQLQKDIQSKDYTNPRPYSTSEPESKISKEAAVTPPQHTNLPSDSSIPSAASGYAKGYITGRVLLLQGLTQRLREDEELRTVVSVAEVLNNMLEDETKQRDEVHKR
jgi:hypothetical protein